jgi:uncharacterized protein YbjQ (UPF0145 family)
MAKEIQVVTTGFFPGHDVDKVKGIVWGTTVRAKFIGKDVLALLRILVGGEVKEYTNMVNEARLIALKKMVLNAKKLGADAVIQVRIGTVSQILPGAVELFAYGTAVTLKKKRK